jgi:putative CocE/NonD family hydrolase
VLTVGGWYDGEDMFGALECFKSIDHQSPSTDNHLMMGPWSHGQWVGAKGASLGQGDWGQSTAKVYREQMEKPFFDHHLLGSPDPKLPKAFVFEVGTNQWRRFDVWPPAETRTVSFYFQGDGRLSKEKPTTPSGFDLFISDPARPVPYKNDISTYHTQTYLVDDQRFAATRPDVLEDLVSGDPFSGDSRDHQGFAGTP